MATIVKSLMDKEMGQAGGNRKPCDPFRALGGAGAKCQRRNRRRMKKH